VPEGAGAGDAGASDGGVLGDVGALGAGAGVAGALGAGALGAGVEGAGAGCPIATTAHALVAISESAQAVRRMPGRLSRGTHPHRKPAC